MSRTRQNGVRALMTLGAAAFFGAGAACGLFPSLDGFSDDYGGGAGDGSRTDAPGLDDASNDAVVSDDGSTDGGGPQSDASGDASTCAPGLLACQGACADPSRDHENCGACAHRCAASETCAASSCLSAVYLAPPPLGDDVTGQGTEASPWKTFGKALAASQQPGSAIVLLDGDYEPGTTGVPRFDCSGSGNAGNGSATKPMALVAKNERKAVLHGMGIGAAMHVVNCNYWLFEGLAADSADLAPDAGGQTESAIVWVSSGSNLTLRRMLVSKTNRWLHPDEAGIFLKDVNYGLLEDVELYAFTNAGMVVSAGTGNVVRRAYTNARDWVPLNGGTRSPWGIMVQFSSGTALVENSIADYGAGGFFLSNGGGSYRIVGSAAVNTDDGLSLGGNGMISAENLLSFGGPVRLDSLTGVAALTNTTVIADYGFWVGTANGSLHLQNFLGLVSSWGFNLSGSPPEPTLSGDHTNIFGSPTNYPPDASFTNAVSEDPGNVGKKPGQCVAYVPDGGSMSDAGVDGGPIGANLVYRYEDGGLTQERLFAPVTGAFPCRAVVAGVNDVPDASCTDVHTRLRFGAPSCPVPP